MLFLFYKRMNASKGYKTIKGIYKNTPSILSK